MQVVGYPIDRIGKVNSFPDSLWRQRKRYVEALERGETVLLEGAQGTLLDLETADGVVPALILPTKQAMFWIFDRRTGELVALGETDMTGPRLELWRAPIENDVLTTFGSYLDVDPPSSRGLGSQGPSTAERWSRIGLDRLQRRIRPVAFHLQEFSGYGAPRP